MNNNVVYMHKNKMNNKVYIFKDVVEVEDLVRENIL